MFEGDKQCRKCGEVKPVGMFSPMRGGYQPNCKACRNASKRAEYRGLNREFTRHSAIPLRGEVPSQAAMVCETAGIESVVVFRRAGRSYMAHGDVFKGELIGVYDHGCDYRQVIGDLAA